VIVVDTNLIAYLLIDGGQTELAERVLQKDEVWVSPLLWRSELCNALVKCVRGGLFGLNAAFRIMTEAESLMAGNEYAVVSGDVLSLAASSACSAYDAEFVVLARELGVPLVTSDKQLLESFPETVVSPARFLAR
jgi:predicted nucleic acid-binding protein